MNTSPSPIALAIAQVIEGAMAPIFAPLVARIEALEKRPDLLDDALFASVVMTAIRNQPSIVVDLLGEEIDKRAPTDEFIEKATSAVLASSEFDEAVLGVIEDRSSEVIENLGDDLTDKITNGGDIAERVGEVIRAGSFNIEFTSY